VTIPFIAVLVPNTLTISVGGGLTPSSFQLIHVSSLVVKVVETSRCWSNHPSGMSNATRANLRWPPRQPELPSDNDDRNLVQIVDDLWHPWSPDRTTLRKPINHSVQQSSPFLHDAPSIIKWIAIQRIGGPSYEDLALRSEKFRDDRRRATLHTYRLARSISA
jgi:hypothetical protein